MLSNITTTVLTAKEDYLKYNKDGSILLTCFFMKKTDYLYGEKLEQKKAVSIPVYLTIKTNEDNEVDDELIEPETWLTVSGMFIPNQESVAIECLLNPFTGHHIRKVDPRKGGANLVSLLGTTKKADPYVNEAQTVTRFTLRVNRSKDDAYWIKCNAFKKQAKNIAQFIEGGDQLGVTGTLGINTYLDKNGEKRKEPELTVNSFSLIQKPKSNSSSSSSDIPSYSEESPSDIPSSDIPF